MRDDIGIELAVVRIDGLSVMAGTSMVLDGITLALGGGGPTVLVGPNGAGKTTLLKVMMGLLAPASGTVTLAVRPAAFVFQKPVMLRRSAAANVAFALTAAGLHADPARGAALLDRVGLASLGDRPARLLSGGEQQRLALARALACDPRILFLDEPTASLDPAQTKVVEDIIQRAAADGVKIVMATHDLGEARRIASDVVLLAGGRVVEHAPAAEFFSAPKSEIAQRFLAGELIL